MTPTEPAVALSPIINPPMVTVNADALMAAPDIVIMTAVEEVALQVAVKFGTLLEPAAAVGVTADAKKLEGNVRVTMLPDEIGTEGMNTRVMGTNALPATRSEKEIPKVDKKMQNTSGNITPNCVCNGPPPASNVDTLTLAAAAAAAAFVNPATVHTIAAVGDAGAASMDRFSSSTPEEEVKAADTVTVDGLRLEQEADAAVELRAEKRKPAMDTTFIVVEFMEGTTTKDTIKVTPVFSVT